MEKQNKLDNMVTTAMENLNRLADVNTVVGKPFDMPDGTTVIPISKITMGFLTGGGEYGELKVLKPDASYPFAGGSGAVLSMKPAGFLVQQNGSMRLVPVSDQPYEKLIDAASEFLERITEDKHDKKF